MGAVIVLSTAGCADENFTRDVEARWCELVAVDCAPPPPLQPPVLNPPPGGDRPAGPGYLLPGAEGR
ncbi:hypothetical protein [Mycolicibacterium frederiksbergense]|uniref:hypothetical protein n=1 Tax=Mycolicibacterium frederiksbergense TaxID=117567 RepID=UPI00265B94BE|nr:hypothetical protein [Mycolicibacterium frederiksbergense]MDO0975181.1 hypothetical protein [Mycolicibacterium frederiksbergense]